jgi:hypothetical protein
MVLNDSNNLVAVEPIKSTCDGLLSLGQKLKKPFRVFCGVLRGTSSEFLQCKGEKNSYAHCSSAKQNTTTTENLTIYQLQERFNIQFDTIIIDCEGCYTSFIEDILNLKQIKQIQIEWDGVFLENDILRAGFKCTAIYQHVCLPKGIRVYDRI